MDKELAERVLTSNLETIVYQSAELIKDQQPSIYYSDFFTLYTQQRAFLRTTPWMDTEVEKLVQQLPALAQPLLTNKLVLVLIPAVLFSISPFNWIGFPLYLALLASLYYVLRAKNKKRLREINQLTNQLLLTLKMKKG